MEGRTIEEIITTITTYIKFANYQLVNSPLTNEDTKELDELIEDLVLFEKSKVWEGIKLFENVEKFTSSLREVSEAFLTIQEAIEKLMENLAPIEKQIFIPLEKIQNVLPRNINEDNSFFVNSKSLSSFYAEILDEVERLNKDMHVILESDIDGLRNNILLLSEIYDISNEDVEKQLADYNNFVSKVIDVSDLLQEKIQAIYSYYFHNNYINKLYPKKYLISPDIIEQKAKVLYSERVEVNDFELNGWYICASRDEVEGKGNLSRFKTLTASEICKLSENQRFYNDRTMELLLDIYKMPVGTKIEWQYHEEGWIERLLDLNTNSDVDFPKDESVEEINKILEMS